MQAIESKTPDVSFESSPNVNVQFRCEGQSKSVTVVGASVEQLVGEFVNHQRQELRRTLVIDRAIVLPPSLPSPS